MNSLNQKGRRDTDSAKVEFGLKARKGFLTENSLAGEWARKGIVGPFSLYSSPHNRS
jgi:hypothetical protein